MAIPDSSTVFLVSGGARGITSECVVELARQFRSRFILLGRTSLAEEPSWAQGIAGEAELKTSAITETRGRGEKPVPTVVSKAVHSVLAQREIRQTVAAVKAAGGDAVYVSVDITDRAALQTSLAAGNAFGPINGVIHGAGNLADKLIEHKTEADFETVYSAKVTGLENILAVVPATQLDYLILFSSVAGFYGNVGQADYAIANEVLNKTAHQFRKHHPACKVIAINWGPWDGGMVTPQLREYFDSLDIKVIPVKVGTHMLADELRTPGQSPAQIVVGSAIRAQPGASGAVASEFHIHRRLRLADSPFLRDHVVNSRAVLPMVSAMSWMANACEQTHRGYHFYAFDDYRVLKGILFDETLADEYTLDLTEVSNTADEIVIDAMVRSQSSESKPRFHYKARLMLRTNLPAAPVLAAVTENANSAEIPGAQFYQNGTLFHGPSFQGVDRILALSERGVIMRCMLPPTDATYQGQFPVQAFNYAMVDIGLHGMGIWSQHVYQMGSLPLRAAGGRFYRRGEFGQTYYVTMEVRSHSETNVIAGITLYDEDGRVYVVIDDLEVTMSRNLNELFLKNQLLETRP
ncbi:MAG TPA: SDR family NAD(P)-dependent oxidoreductase [Candidatus Limnocylindrales bacterium]|nr:SDR family NAD(P)-dependent oxidoreductase [Candidatus Limnocylindrales bacterium]